MSHFLDRLATLALGPADPSAARSSLPPRFAARSDTPLQRSPPIADEKAAPVAVAGPIATANTAGARRPPLQKIGDLAKSPKTIDLTGETVGLTANPNQVHAPHSSEAASRQAPPSAQSAPAAQLAPRSAVAPLSLSSILEAVSQATARRQQNPAARNFESPPPAVRAAPLDEAVLANRAQVNTAPAPAINVTIDHIEVRAPAKEKPPAAARPRREPMVSLSDYLRGGMTGVRR